MTAVEWLENEMQKTYIFNQNDFNMFKQAKEMEIKQQERMYSEEEAKQETQGYICPQTKKQCDDECCVSAEDCHIEASFGIISDCEPPKQETLEEVAERLFPVNTGDESLDYQNKVRKLNWIAGAKWQQERMYSEESECVNMYLDDLKIQRKSEDGQEYSIVGRIKLLESRYLKQMSDVESHYLSKKETMYSEEDMKEAFIEGYKQRAEKSDLIFDNASIMYAIRLFKQFKNK